MTRPLWKSSCCGAPLDSYKATECPTCGEPCEAEPIDYDPPDFAWENAEEDDA